MKKFLFLSAVLFSNYLIADTECVEPFIFDYGFESKVKYKCIEKENCTKIKNSIFALLENQDAWVESKVALSIYDVSCEHQSAKVSIERMVIGYKVLETKIVDLSLALARAKTDEIFDSKMQCGSFFNGILATYFNRGFKLQLGERILTHETNTFGFIGQASYVFELEYPAAISYNLTDWSSIDDYMISQITVSSRLQVPSTVPVFVRMGFLKNHLKPHHSNGLFAGFSAGSLLNKYDFLFETDLQYTGDYLIPYFDYNGIGTGVEFKTSFLVTQKFLVYAKLGLSTTNSKDIFWQIEKDDIYYNTCKTVGQNRFELCGVYKW